MTELTETVAETAEATRALTGQNVGFLVVGAGVGVAVGFSIGFFLMEKRVKTKYEKMADDEIESMRERFNKEREAYQRGPKPPIDRVMRDLGYLPEEDGIDVEARQYTEEELAAIRETNAAHPGEEEAPEEEDQGEPDETAPEEDVKVVSGRQNIFAAPETEANGVWDYEAEERLRRPDIPYIIHVDEFRQNEPEHDQLTYTYYEEDDILTDSAERRIVEFDGLLGTNNLTKWGHGSKDPNIVYIRNDRLRIDAEVLRDRGSYHETHHAIRHSSGRRRTTRGRFDDES